MTLGINYIPEKPILTIAPYVGCTNKSKLSFYSRGATGYYVLYGTTSGGLYPNSIYVPANQGFYNVPSLTNGSHYYFTVSAVNSVGFSTNAIEVNQII